MGGLSFTTWTFAAAGALFALGPIIIHLLNRRRYKVIQWGAMDFLRQALKKQCRKLQIRDLVLLALRTAAVLLFGIALARPYLAIDGQTSDARQALHAVVVIDNSLSMALASLDGSALEKAKERARQMIEELPAGSRATVLAACGTRARLSNDPYESKEAAAEALEKIETVERSLNVRTLRNTIERACQAAPELAKRIILFTDRQELNWREAESSSSLAGLPPVQVVSVGSEDWGNTWIADVRMQDGLADIETPATVTVDVAHRGPAARRDVQVTLQLGETVLGQKTISLEADASRRQVDFECSFNGLVELPAQDRPVFVPLRAAIAPDRLAEDDERFLVAPVVAALSVVFIDQYGAKLEDPAQGRIGETRALRRLLAPRTSRADAPRQLVSVRHLNLAEVTREQLAGARLVIIAGVANPGAVAPLLAEYVRLGGQLVICAGGEFDPAAWMEAAWLAGNGVLPLPLKGTIGQTPGATTDELRPFFLSAESLLGESYFQLSGVPAAELAELYAEPLFFKAVEVDASAGGARNSPPASGEIENWLTWAQADLNGEATDTASRETRVLGRFDLPGQPPFLVARRIGRGEVVFCATGVTSAWNALAKTNAMLLFDRILRGMILRTLPARNFAAADEFTLPLPRYEQNSLVTLMRPGEAQAEPVDVTFVDAERRGMNLEGLFRRGVYRVRGHKPSDEPAPTALEAVSWEVALAVNGPSEESDLSPIADIAMAKLANEHVSFVLGNEPIQLLGAASRGQHTWWWLAVAVLALLLVEMSVLLWPSVAAAPAARLARSGA
jgi:hypothetical protein